MKLTIELVPRTCHFKNLRSEVTKSTWDKLRRESYQKADYVCEICGGIGPNHPVECHEIWDYDDDKHIQKLVGLISLCPSCHQVKHMGLAQIQGKLPEAAAHFAEVNNINMNKAWREIAEAFTKYDERSEYQWKLDITWLNDILVADLEKPVTTVMSPEALEAVIKLFED
jgi:hypothetical protein